MISYQPSKHFLRSVKQLDDYLIIKWDPFNDLMEIWSALPNKWPVMEYRFHRNNKWREEKKKKPLLNWDMEWIVLNQLRDARRWQFVDATTFQQEMLMKREKFVEVEQKKADEKFDSLFMDDYWSEKGKRELNNDYSKVTTKWNGTTLTQEGNKNGNENMEH